MWSFLKESKDQFFECIASYTERNIKNDEYINTFCLVMNYINLYMQGRISISDFTPEENFRKNLNFTKIEITLRAFIFKVQYIDDSEFML